MCLALYLTWSLPLLSIHPPPLQRNPEEYSYHRGLQCALLETPEHMSMTATQLPASLPLTTDQVDLLLGVYDELIAESPRCKAHRRIPLDFLPGTHPRFAQALDSNLRPALRKGVPSAFNGVKPLYADADKATAIDKLSAAYLEAARKGERLPVVEGAIADRLAAEEPELKTTLLWVLLLRAQVCVCVC